MLKYSFALLGMTIFILPAGLMACDDDESRPVYVHFKDGPAPINPPIVVDAEVGDPAHYKCGSFYVYRDYGPARVVVPPAPLPTRHPSS
jgi:hypothetical protein